MKFKISFLEPSGIVIIYFLSTSCRWFQCCPRGRSSCWSLLVSLVIRWVLLASESQLWLTDGAADWTEGVMAFELEMFDGGWIVLWCVKYRVFAVHNEKVHEDNSWVVPVIAVSQVHWFTVNLACDLWWNSYDYYQVDTLSESRRWKFYNCTTWRVTDLRIALIITSNDCTISLDHNFLLFIVPKNLFIFWFCHHWFGLCNHFTK